MGIIRMGVPEDIALFIRDTYKVKHFVETGTFHGYSSLWASKHFKLVDTIEFSEVIYKETKNRLGHKNINFIFGDSRSALQNIVATATEPILFWLDAHWCSGASYGELDQCPLIEELKIIDSSPIEHYILIDDARLFEAPPPLPNMIESYPTIKDLVEVTKDKYFSIFEDVIFILPEGKKKDFSFFLQKKTTEAWKERGKRMKQSGTAPKSQIDKAKHFIGNVLRRLKLR